LLGLLCSRLISPPPSLSFDTASWPTVFCIVYNVIAYQEKRDMGGSSWIKGWILHFSSLMILLSFRKFHKYFTKGLPRRLMRKIICKIFVKFPWTTVLERGSKNCKEVQFLYIWHQFLTHTSIASGINYSVVFHFKKTV